MFARALRRFFLPLLPLLFTSACAAATPDDASGTGAEAAQTANGRVGSHGMVVAGSPGAGFISHIPMFNTPHDVQLIVAGTFASAPGRPALPSTLSDRLYTYLPERMSLDALRTGTLHELTGTLYLGNFESGGRPIATGVRFTVTGVVHQHVLEADAVPGDLGYVLFGKRDAAFAAHLIAGAPAFDEVLAVRFPETEGPTDDDLAAGVVGRAAGVADAIDGRLGAAEGPMELGTFAVEARATLSCLEGPDFTAPCR